MRVGSVLLFSLLLAGCAARPTHEVVDVVLAPPIPQPLAPAPPPDTCGAREHQHLVGRPRTEIPVPVRPEQRRVMCTTCPATMDYLAERLNFLFDAKTGLIERISCG